MWTIAECGAQANLLFKHRQASVPSIFGHLLLPGQGRGGGRGGVVSPNHHPSLRQMTSAARQGHTKCYHKKVAGEVWVGYGTAVTDT